MVFLFLFYCQMSNVNFLVFDKQDIRIHDLSLPLFFFLHQTNFISPCVSFLMCVVHQLGFVFLVWDWKGGGFGGQGRDREGFLIFFFDFLFYF